MNKNFLEKSMRDGFGEGLILAGKNNRNVVALTADLRESVRMDDFSKKFPERFFEIGVAEQNMASVASGMAKEGLIPFIASFAMFSPGRNWEQIRTTICYNNVPVKIIGHHTGLSSGLDGGSHQALEDIALMRSLPRMNVISPCDAIEAKKAVLESVNLSEPVYIRVSRNLSPVITEENDSFQIGKARVVLESEKYCDVGIIATGQMVARAIKAGEILQEEGINVTVLNLSTIKPLDVESLIRLAEDSGAIVTAEEHQIFGGMGSTVSECLSENYPVPIEFVGVKDLFGQSGKSEDLMKTYSLEVEDIIFACKKVLKRK